MKPVNLLITSALIAISQHGFALNVSPEMSHFENIIACGLKDHAVISLADLLDAPPTLAAVQAEVVQQFGAVFEREMIATTP